MCFKSLGKRKYPLTQQFCFSKVYPKEWMRHMCKALSTRIFMPSCARNNIHQMENDAEPWLLTWKDDKYKAKAAQAYQNNCICMYSHGKKLGRIYTNSLSGDFWQFNIDFAYSCPSSPPPTMYYRIMYYWCKQTEIKEGDRNITT